MLSIEKRKNIKIKIKKQNDNYRNKKPTSSPLKSEWVGRKQKDKGRNRNRIHMSLEQKNLYEFILEKKNKKVGSEGRSGSTIKFGLRRFSGVGNKCAQKTERRTQIAGSALCFLFTYKQMSKNALKS